MKRLLVFLSLFPLSILTAGWMKTYGDIYDDYGQCVRTTKDGGYIVVGTTSSYGLLPVSLWLLKLDANGDTTWMHTYGRKAKSSLSSSGVGVVEIPDGGYVTAGISISGNVVLDSRGYGVDEELITMSLEKTEIAMWLLKTNSAGGAIWERTYLGKHASTAHYLCATSDGNFVAVGTAADTSGKKPLDHLYIVKASIRGDEMWNKIYMGDVSSGGSCIVETPDKGLAACGRRGEDAWLLKTDSAGNILWARTYGGSKDDVALSLAVAADGGFFMAGSTLSAGAGKTDLWLARTDSLGDTLWTKTYGGEKEDCGMSIVVTPGGGAVIAGYTKSQGAGRKDAWLLEVDSEGKLLWQKTFGTWQDEEATSVDKTTDGGYVVTGYFTQKGSQDLWIAKVDSKGNVN